MNFGLLALPIDAARLDAISDRLALQAAGNAHGNYYISMPAENAYALIHQARTALLLSRTTLVPPQCPLSHSTDRSPPALQQAPI